MKKTPGPNPLSDREAGRRELRSFVLREGRLTPGQARALETLWPRYGIPNQSGLLDLDGLFSGPGPLHVEVGFGDGEALVFAARQSAQQHFIGIEVHRPGVGRLMRELDESGLDNVRILCADAVTVLRDRLPSACLDSLRLFFPDPWPKKRHHKRRIVQAGFVSLVRDRLKPGGLFHLATDWEPYLQHMLEILEAMAGLENTGGAGQTVERPAWRPQTRFERRGLRKGHGVWDLIYRRTGEEG